MCSISMENGGSPKKRTLSRGMSEDESLRSIIKESETSSRRLTRSDSRPGTLKRRSDLQESGQDPIMGLPEMLELQASYDEAAQELHGLEVEREALLFQVDVLQDTLEGVEELLAEAQREAGQASSDLVREQETNRKLESLVHSLMQELERLREERDNQHISPVEVTDETLKQEGQNNNVTEVIQTAMKTEKDAVLCEACKAVSGNRVTAASQKVGEGPGNAGGAVTKLQRMNSQPFGHLPSLALGNLESVDGVLQRPYENHVEEEEGDSADRNDSESISAYEDASADTPEHERMLAGEDELPSDAESMMKTPTHNRLDDSSEVQEPKSPDSCILS